MHLADDVYRHRRFPAAHINSFHLSEKQCPAAVSCLRVCPVSTKTVFCPDGFWFYIVGAFKVDRFRQTQQKVDKQFTSAAAILMPSCDKNTGAPQVQ